MGLRYILLGVVLWLLITIIRRFMWRRREDRREKQSLQAMNMVACDYCGIHLPQSEAVSQEDHYYCCKEHARQSKQEEEA